MLRQTYKLILLLFAIIAVLIRGSLTVALIKDPIRRRRAILKSNVWACKMGCWILNA
jgi:hypothetical protein